MLQGRAMSAEAHKQQQAKCLYVMNVEGKRTTGPLLIGLMDYFQRWLPNVGYFEVNDQHDFSLQLHLHNLLANLGQVDLSHTSSAHLIPDNGYHIN